MIVLSAWPVLLLAAFLRFQDTGLEPVLTPPPQAQRQSDHRQKADALFLEGKLVESLPLYTALAKNDPSEPLYAERRAAGLIAKSATRNKLPQQLALQRSAYAELMRAKALGDTSPYVLMMLEKLRQLFEGAPAESAAPPADPVDLLKQGVAAQAKNDFQSALKCFQAAANADPTFYDAALYAGEAEQRLGNDNAAGAWFNKAIKINPNRETAYADWGNTLLNSNQLLLARDRFIDGILAWPYARSSWDGLTRWAKMTHAEVYCPHLIRPLVNEHFDPRSVSEDGTGRAAWLPYMLGRHSYQATQFHQTFPSEKQYRHSLAEEVTSLQRTVEALRKLNIPPAKLDANLSTLLMLSDNHMLEPFVLLHAADSGIVQDYAAYRASHREQLRLFILQYDIHGGSQIVTHLQ
jgi:tetratricopeptide (TPR) repeat protein